MTYFASKKEAVVTGAIAAFFVLVAVGFSFEPLVTVIIKSRNLPEGTNVFAKIPANIDNNQLFADGATIVSALGVQIPKNKTIINDIYTLFGAVTGVRTLTIVSKNAGLLPITLSLSGTTDKEIAALPLINLIASRTYPSEDLVKMPDNTSYTELVVDPDKADPSRLPIPLQITTQNSFTNISTSNNPLNKANYYLSPMSCTQLPDGVKIINFAKLSQSLGKNIILSLKQYISGFECFQGFSTFD